MDIVRLRVGTAWSERLCARGGGSVSRIVAEVLSPIVPRGTAVPGVMQSAGPPPGVMADASLMHMLEGGELGVGVRAGPRGIGSKSVCPGYRPRGLLPGLYPVFSFRGTRH